MINGPQGLRASRRPKEWTCAASSAAGRDSWVLLAGQEGCCTLQSKEMWLAETEQQLAKKTPFNKAFYCAYLLSLPGVAAHSGPLSCSAGIHGSLPLSQSMPSLSTAQGMCPAPQAGSAAPSLHHGLLPSNPQESQKACCIPYCV